MPLCLGEKAERDHCLPAVLIGDGAEKPPVARLRMQAHEN